MCGQGSGWWLLHHSPSSLVGAISVTEGVRGPEGKDFDIDGCQPALDFACGLRLESHTVWMRSSHWGHQLLARSATHQQIIIQTI